MIYLFIQKNRRVPTISSFRWWKSPINAMNISFDRNMLINYFVYTFARVNIAITFNV